MPDSQPKHSTKANPTPAATPESAATASTPPMRRKGMLTAERILDAAETHFAQHGYAGTSLREVADAVGIRIPSLYNHFPNKASLYTAVLERGITPILEALGRFVTQAENQTLDPAAVLREMMLVMAERPNIPRLIQYELLDGGEHLAPMLESWMQPVISRGLELLLQGPAASIWTQEQLPLLLLAMYNMVTGHLTSSSLLETIYSRPARSPESMALESEFFTQLIGKLVGIEPSATSAQLSDEEGLAKV